MFLGLPFLASVTDDENAASSQTLDADAAPGGLTSEPEDLTDDAPQVIAFEDNSVPHVHGHGCGHSQWDTTADPATQDPVGLEALDQIANDDPSPMPMQDAEDSDADWLNTNNIPHICYGCHDCHVQVT
ncbi:MAG: hypothetical protein ACPG5U_06625 [Planktomarina sp.]